MNRILEKIARIIFFLWESKATKKYRMEGVGERPTDEGVIEGERGTSQDYSTDERFKKKEIARF